MKARTLPYSIKLLAGVAQVLGHKDLTFTKLDSMRLNRQEPMEAYQFNAIQDALSGLGHQVIFTTPTNTVVCVSLKNGKPVPRMLLSRSDIRVLEKPLDMEHVTRKYERARHRHPELALPRLEADKEKDRQKLLYWGVTEGVLKTRVDPHLAESGPVLPMTHLVLLLEKTKTARTIVHDQSAAFSSALGPMIVFNQRNRAKSNDNGRTLYLDTFAARVRRLNELLDIESSDDDDDDNEEEEEQRKKSLDKLVKAVEDDNSSSEEEEAPRKKKKKSKPKSKAKSVPASTKKAKRVDAPVETHDTTPVKKIKLNVTRAIAPISSTTNSDEEMEIVAPVQQAPTVSLALSLSSSSSSSSEEEDELPKPLDSSGATTTTTIPVVEPPITKKPFVLLPPRGPMPSQFDPSMVDAFFDNFGARFSS